MDLPSPTRQRMSNELVRKALRASLAADDLGQVRFHDLRHTFASLLIQREANPKYIQQQLGHGSISITLDIYSHLFQGDHRHHVHQLDDPQEKRSKHRETTQAEPMEEALNLKLAEAVDV
jgi:integrase